LRLVRDHVFPAPIRERLGMNVVSTAQLIPIDPGDDEIPF
jgi:hypothetical protein